MMNRPASRRRAERHCMTTTTLEYNCSTNGFISKKSKLFDGVVKWAVTGSTDSSDIGGIYLPNSSISITKYCQ